MTRPTMPSPLPPVEGDRDLREAMAYTLAMRVAMRPSKIEGVPEWKRVGYASPEADARANTYYWYGLVDDLLAGPLASLIAEREQFEADKARGHRYRDKLLFRAQAAERALVQEARRAGAAEVRLNEAAAAEARASTLSDALRFYAEPKSYQQSGWQGDPEPAPVLSDGGDRARTALAPSPETRTMEVDHG